MPALTVSIAPCTIIGRLKASSLTRMKGASTQRWSVDQSSSSCHAKDVVTDELYRYSAIPAGGNFVFGPLERTLKVAWNVALLERSPTRLLGFYMSPSRLFRHDICQPV